MRTFIALLVAACTVCLAQAQAPDPARVIASAGIAGVIAPGATPELLRTGFSGTEGVIGLPDGSVLFCEQNANRIVKIDQAGVFSTYLEDSNRTIGLGVDRKGRLIAAQSREPRIGALTPERVTVADAFGGQPLVRPNDLVIDRKGGVYFTDPIPSPQLAFRPPPPGRKGLLLYVRPDGVVTQPTDAIAEPNGVQLSPDEKTLYAVDGDHITAFDVAKDGALKNPRLFAAVRGDGLAVDGKGRLYAATDAGVQVIGAKGEPLGLIASPVRIQSIAFGGKDKRTLFAAGSGAVYRIPLLAKGVSHRAK